jgi:arylsulfatase A-like enzyme
VNAQSIGARLLTAALALLAVATERQTLPAAERPNIVILYADDLGYGDVQCNNPERGKIATPHINRLAAEGLRFTDGHSSSGVCSPSRYALLTGRYHWRTRLQAGIVGLWEQPLIAPDRMTIATLAKQHGYRTACIGKWHLGWDWPIPADRAALFKERPPGEAIATAEHQAVWRDVFQQAVPGGPTTRGFDQYFGTDVPNWPPYCFIKNDRTVGIPSEFLPRKLLVKNQASNQGPALPGWTLEPILPTLAARAEEFIHTSAKQPDPFLLYFPLTAPHTPLAVNAEWQGRSGLGVYGDFVMETDAVIGRVLAALQASGEARNTLVVLTSDNGCAPYIGVPALEQQGHFPSGPLRGYKTEAFEGGHRVPFIIRWPGVTVPGHVCNQLVHQADLLATLADIWETSLPANAGEDSFSLLPLLRGEDRPVRETAVSCSSQGVPSLRLGTWKYIAGPVGGGRNLPADRTEPVRLYDLARDIGETTNLASEHPAQLSEMQARLETLISRGRSTPGERQPNDVRVRRFPADKAVE